MTFNPYNCQPDEAHMGRIERRIRIAGTISTVAFLIIGGLAWKFLPALLEMPSTFHEALRYSLRWSLPAFLVLLTAVMLVSTGRRLSAADVAGAAAGPPSSRIAIKVAFLQNTLEQTVLAVGSYLVMASVLVGAWLALVPVAAAFFLVGRILFYRGYKSGAEGRALGMSLTMIPTAVLYVVALIGLLASFPL